jgi:ABC-type lipoprotein export system ATPase subunit
MATGDTVGKASGGAASGRGDHARRQIAVSCVRRPRLGRPSVRTAAVGAQFGIPLFAGRSTIVQRTKIPLSPGRIVLIVGPSGSGKSSALAEINRRCPGGSVVDRISFPAETAVIDRVAPWASLGKAISILTSCGLGDASLWIRRFDELSDGEKFRAKLARAIALQARGGSAAPLICDEFCSMLHRRAAKTISYNLHKLVRRTNLSVVLASSAEDIIGDLQPHTVVRLEGGGRCRVEDRAVSLRKPISIRRRLRIEPGSKGDYEAFAAMHYRAADELGFVDRVFVMREGSGGDLLGIVVYAHGPLELSLRNQVTDGVFIRDPRRLNRKLRILRRLVIHPDMRGCGLGHYLVRRTLPLVGTDFVECLASMGEFNPVFERAGMKRIGQYDVMPQRKAALEALRAMDIDPNDREFTMHVCRSPRVRRIVVGVVSAWYTSTTGGGGSRVERQSPQLLAQTFRGLIGLRPVYYLWRRRQAA